MKAGKDGLILLTGASGYVGSWLLQGIARSACLTEGVFFPLTRAAGRMITRAIQSPRNMGWLLWEPC